MALTDDQRAMLRLLAQREEGYEDIAALKGVGVEEVKAEVKAALAELAAERNEAEAAPEPPKQAEPAAPPPPPAPEPPAEKPQAPPPKPKAPRGPMLRKPAVPPERRRVLLLAGGAVGVVAVVLIAIAVIGGGSGGSGSSSSEAGVGSTEAASAEAAASGKLTEAELQPVAGESGEGKAIFGRVGKKEIVLQVTATGLAPNAGGESYTVWLYRSPKVSLRIGSVKVGKSGRLGAQLPIPAELLAYVASGAFKQIYLSRTDDAAYARAVVQAKKNKQLPPYSGETVLRGEITGPVVKEPTGEGH